MESEEAEGSGQDGQVDSLLAEALRRECERLAELVDPVQRARAISELFATLDNELPALARIRVDAVVELRENKWSYMQIAILTGLSKTRVAQLAR